MWNVIRKLMYQQGIETIADLSRKSGVSTTAFNRIKKGQIPRTDTLLKISRALNTTTDMLANPDFEIDKEKFKRISFIGEEAPYEIAQEAAKKAVEEYFGKYGIRTEPGPDEIEIPFFSNLARAGTPIEFGELPPDGYINISRSKCNNDPNAYIVVVHGDSMYPELKEGDEVIVSPNSPPEDQDIVLLWISGEGICVRRLQIIDSIKILISGNPRFKPVILTEKKYEILGKVVYLRRKFK